ncbi:MAG: hypothetical protein LCH54_01750 [Bacteroidetes bacterium]|nr:hypothetical protein [Bacteroidota bacterium]
MKRIFKTILFSGLIFGLPFTGFSQSDSTLIRIYPKENSPVDTTDFFEKKLRLSSVQPIFAGTSKYGDLFAGFNFAFGTIFDGKIKSSYPGFIGFGIQAGLKYKSGFLVEAGWKWHQFNSDVSYLVSSRLSVAGNDSISSTSTVSDAQLSTNTVLLTLVYSDYRSPFLPLRYVYGGLGLGAVRFEETGSLVLSTREKLSGLPEQITTSKSGLSYQYWNPVISVVVGMNFLYLPESHNWFSFDLRLDMIPNLHKTGGASVFSRANNLNGLRATVRFYFDFRQE